MVRGAPLAHQGAGHWPRRDPLHRRRRRPVEGTARDGIGRIVRDTPRGDPGHVLGCSSYRTQWLLSWIWMLPPASAVTGSDVSEVPIWLSYTTTSVSGFQILIRNLSTPPPPGRCPSVAVSRNLYVPVPFTVPVPLYWAFAPAITIQS